MKQKMNFIRTSSAETADKLRYEGYTELKSTDSGIYCFLNDGEKLRFRLEDFDAVYTNTLFI